MKALPRKDLEGDGTSPFITPAPLEEIFYKNLQDVYESGMALPDKWYPIEVIHQDDDGYILLRHDDKLYVAQSTDFDYEEVDA
jgi:hypothetical protein